MSTSQGENTVGAKTHVALIVGVDGKLLYKRCKAEV